MKEAADEGGTTMNWIGWMFAAALTAITFEIYSDASVTRCVPGSFFAMVGLCSQSRPG
jgi:hypothetical protein